MTNKDQDKPKAIENERLVSIKKAAYLIGIDYKQLLRAANAGELPLYKLGNSYRFVLVSEVLACMRSTSKTKESPHDY